MQEKWHISPNKSEILTIIADFTPDVSRTSLPKGDLEGRIFSKIMSERGFWGIGEADEY